MKTLVLTAAALVVVASNALAQQPAPPPTARPAVLRSAPPIRGFSVVLVSGDTQGASSSEGVPQAAAQALADLKAFLPYKAYQLLDTEWTLGGDKTRTLLSGPEGHTYELYLTAETASVNEVQITGFRLQELGPGMAMVTTRSGSGVTSVDTAKLSDLEKQLAKEKASGNADPATANSIQQEVETIRANAISRMGGRAVIDTSFRMNVGETVVVGTSRLQGSKALVVLLTAVGR